MRSVKVFANYSRENRRQKGWLWIISILIFTVFTFSFFMQDVLMDTDRMYFGLYNIKMMWITVALAVASAFQGYGFLLQAKTVDFYYSLPIKRKHLFWGNYWNGIFVYFIPMLVSQHICFLMVCGFGKEGWSTLFSYLVWGICIHMLAFFFFYHLTILAIHLAGNVIGAIGILAILLWYMQIVLDNLCLPLCRKFFETFYQIDALNVVRTYGVPWELYSSLNGLYRPMALHKYVYAAEWTEIVMIVVWSSLLLAVCIVLQKKRTAECTGTTIAFSVSEKVLHVLVDVAAGLLVGNLFLTFMPESYEVSGGVTGCIVGSGFSYLLLEMVFRMRFENQFRRKGWLRALGEGAVAVMVVFGFVTEKGAYDSYLPSTENIASVAISLAGVDEKENDTSTKERLRNVRLTEKEDVLKVKAWIGEELFGNKKEEALAEATIAYHLENGKVIYREYPIADVEQIEAFNPIYTTNAYKKGIYKVLSYVDSEQLEITWTNQIEQMTLNLSVEETKELMRIYSEELTALDIPTIEKELPIGKLLVTDGAFGETMNAYLYPSFEKTLDILNKYQIPVTKKISEYEIAKIEVTELRGGMKVMQKRDTYTVPEEMQKIAEQLVYQGYAIQPVLNPVDTQTRAEVKFQNHGRETVYTVDYYVK